MRAPLSWSKHLPKTPSSKRLLLLFSCSTMSESLWSHELQYARLPCPSLSPKVCSNSCPLSQWYHPIISSSVAPFSSCPQCFPASGSFPWVGSSHQVAKVSELQLQQQSSQWDSRLISLRIVWFDLLAVQATLKGLLQHHSMKASILWHSACFMVQLSHPYMTTGKTIALTIQNFDGKVISLLCNMLSRLVIAFLPRSKLLLISWL